MRILISETVETFIYVVAGVGMIAFLVSGCSVGVNDARLSTELTKQEAFAERVPNYDRAGLNALIEKELGK
jgi:hypothetical protein